MTYPCSGCYSRFCDGRCFDETEADYDPLFDERKLNEERLRRKIENELRFTMKSRAA